MCIKISYRLRGGLGGVRENMGKDIKLAFSTPLRWGRSARVKKRSRYAGMRFEM